MIISDLNHLEAVEGTGVVGGGGVYFDNYFKKYDDINIKEKVDIDKKFDIYARVYGNSALSQSTADAYGYDTSAQTFTATQTDSYKSEALGLSQSVSN